MLQVISLVWIRALAPDIIDRVFMAEIVKSPSMRTREADKAREIGGPALVTFWSGLLTATRGGAEPRGQA